MTGAGRVLSLVAGLSYALILAPIIVVIVMAFSADSFILFPPSGFSLRWFKTLVGNAPLMKALGLSVQIALVVTLLSLAGRRAGGAGAGEGRVPRPRSLARLLPRAAAAADADHRPRAAAVLHAAEADGDACPASRSAT